MQPYSMHAPGVIAAAREAIGAGPREPTPAVAGHEVVVGRFDELLTAGLRAALAGQPDLELVAFDVEHQRLSETVERLRPAAVICDASLFRRPGDVLAVRGAAGTRIVAVAERLTPSDVRRLTGCGVTACLTRQARLADVCDAVRLACRGLRVTPDRGRHLLDVDAGLTVAETQVVELVDAGLSIAEISAERHCSVATTKSHLQRIYRKFGVGSREELLRRRATHALHSD